MPVPHFNFLLLEIFYGFCFFQAQHLAGNGHPRNIFTVSIPILINIIALKYQNQQQSPFDSHPKTAFSGILILLLYFPALDYQQRLAMHLHRPLALAGFIHRCVLVLGYMATAILVSLIFPDSASGAVYALYIALSVGDVVVLVCRKMGELLKSSVMVVTAQNTHTHSGGLTRKTKKKK